MAAGYGQRMLGACYREQHQGLEDPGTDEVPKKESRMLNPNISSRVAALHRGELHAEADGAQIAAPSRLLCRKSPQNQTLIEVLAGGRFRAAIPAFVAVVAFALSTPFAVAADDQVPVLAPDTAPTWDETSGYGAVEASRAETVAYIRSTASTTADAATGSSAVEVNRSLVAQHALQAGDLGSVQEEALRAVVASAMTWDETSGYGAVEASRASIAHPDASTNQVPSDVRWAPARAFAPDTSAEANRVLNAQQALLTGDIGSMQEERLYTIVAAGPSWDETSGYGAVEAARAER
jgi:hypothetical protein